MVHEQNCNPTGLGDINDVDLSQVGLVSNTCIPFYKNGQLAHIFSDILWELIPSNVAVEWQGYADFLGDIEQRMDDICPLRCDPENRSAKYLMAQVMELDQEEAQVRK